MNRKRSYEVGAPDTNGDEALMEKALELGCWRCRGAVKRVGLRKVVCVMCACELEWMPTVDGS